MGAFCGAAHSPVVVPFRFQNLQVLPDPFVGVSGQFRARRENGRLIFGGKGFGKAAEPTVDLRRHRPQLLYIVLSENRKDRSQLCKLQIPDVQCIRKPIKPPGVPQKGIPLFQNGVILGKVPLIGGLDAADGRIQKLPPFPRTVLNDGKPRGVEDHGGEGSHQFRRGS